MTGTYLCVGPHDLASFLVEGLTVPLGVQPLQLTSQTVVLTQKQRVNCRQGDVLIHTDVTWEEGVGMLQPIPSHWPPLDL